MMSLFDKEHYELLAQFEKDIKYGRFDKEPKEKWRKGVIYQDGQVNNLFLLYRKGYAFGRTA